LEEIRQHELQSSDYAKRLELIDNMLQFACENRKYEKSKENIMISEKLPIGIQAFETIREQGYLYVDKTRHIYRMVSEGMFYFLARPRRFGKSLLVSILKCLFQGRKELFQGLWIADHGAWDWKEHPVIVLDFNGIPGSTPEELRQSIIFTLVQIAEDEGIVLKTNIPEIQFKELIVGLYKKTGASVAVLIDEYDKRLIDHIGKGEKGIETAKANRDILKSFFGVLKDAKVSPMLCFVFLTGVSKFSKVSIFSELNNLDDISMNEYYADVLGYTQQEIEGCFNQHIEQFSEKIGCSRDKIITESARYYNGYRFSKKDIRVYNPFSVLKAFHDYDFQDYWFETGTPVFLINLLKESRYDFPKIEGLEVSQSVFSTFDIERLRPEALLFQTGYITIRDVQDDIYILDYPNQEVKTSFLELLLYSMTEGGDAEENSKFLRLAGYLKREDFEAFFETVSAIFASVPYDIQSKRDEAYFHTLFYLMISASGADALSSVLTNRGRIDLEVIFSDKVYIIEFKCNQSADAAIAQIVGKGYAEKYEQSGKKVFLMGINFSTEKRNLSEWKVIP